MKNRVEYPYINLLRCIAIYLVVALHCIAPFFNSSSLFGAKTWWVCNILNGITRMGVPIFFMISGFLLLSDGRTLDIKSFYKKRILKVIIPLLCWDIIYFIINCIEAQQSPDLHRFFSELLAQGSKYHLWFAYQIIGIYLLAPFLKRIVDRCKNRELALLFFIILLQPTIFRFINAVQSSVSIAPFGTLIEGYVGFFLLGYMLGTFTFTPTAKRIIYFGGFIGLLVGMIGNYGFSSPERLHYLFNEGYFITHFLTSGAFFLFVREYAPRIKGSVWPIISQLSGLSFGVYFAHVLIIERFAAVIELQGIALNPASYIVISFLITAVVTTLVIYLFSKNKVLRYLM